MRVLHVVRSDGFSGVERHIASLAAAQTRAADSVTVVGGDSASMTRQLAGAGVRTLPGNTLWDVMASIRRAGRPDVVHAHMTAGELAASLANASPLVVTRHFARPRGTTPGGRLAGALIRRRVRAQIAISQFVADAVDGAATVVYPGVETDREPARPRRRVVLVVQRLQPEKNTDVALRAFAAGAPEDWTLEVVGRGPEAGALQNLATTLGVAGRVTFLGFRDDVPDLMRSSSLLLAPCEVEGLGLSVLEAMSHGLPVAASSAGAHHETVGRAPDAQLFEPGDVEQAGAMLARLCADDDLREKYGQQLARVQQSTFTPSAQAEATDAVYRAVLA